MREPVTATRVAPTICFLGVAGSASTTLGLIASELNKAFPGARLLVLDIEAFNTRSTSSLRWPGPGEVHRLRMEQLGLVNFIPRKKLGSNFNLLLNGGPLAFRRFARRARQLLATLRPDVLITCNDTSYVEQAFLGAAKDVGTATILVQEGPFTTVQGGVQGPRSGVQARTAHLLRKLSFLPPRPPYGSFSHDLVLACSDSYAERFAQVGVPPARIRVTGVPRFDHLQPVSAPSSTPPQVVYVFQPFVWQGRVAAEPARAVLTMMAEGLNRAYSEEPFQLLLRQHPRSDRETLRFLEEKLEFSVLYAPDTPLPDVIRSSACSLGHYSVGLLESLILQVPVLCVPIPIAAFTGKDEGEKQAWFETTGVPCAYTAEDVAQKLVTLLRNDTFAAIDVESETGPLDRLAMKRTVAAVKEVLDGRVGASAYSEGLV